MNAPLPESLRKSLENASLEDKYNLSRGRVFISGIQALVRLPMLQRQRDLASGINTSGFVSGYRGSPLGGYDQALWAAKKHLEANSIVFQPGVNEELAATALWGTQQLDIYPQSKNRDGVFGIWYGKGPGVDRCVDVFKHANMAGTAKFGGVIAVAGDDHAAKSSTVAHQSDHVFKACGMPVFFPSNVQDILDLGQHAFAMGRYAGVWTGMKTIQEVVESTASVCVDMDRLKIVTPEDFPLPDDGVHIRWPDSPLEQEARLLDHKLYAAMAYIRANRLNYNVIESPHDRLGIIASGKAYNDMRQALTGLGLDDDVCRRIGIRIHKVNVVWPLEGTITREFSRGLQEILVVEEKRQILEYQIKEILYNSGVDAHPNVIGKFDAKDGDLTGGEWTSTRPSNRWLLRPNADLTPAIIAKAIAKRLKSLGMAPDGSDVADRIDAFLSTLTRQESALASNNIDTGVRAPWFCSGCPHNTSTRVPEGSRALAGIGCHHMALTMDRSTITFSQMGGEGAAWLGQAPFCKDTHVFANLGDGTYFHSGMLAIRQAVAAGVNITYKVLYNDAVAMTGGQQLGERPEGHSVLQIQKSLTSEGVKKLVIVTDEPQKYDGVSLEAGVTVHHRDDLDQIQRQFREIPGCTVIIYDQTCATEKRRRRKRGELSTPTKTAVINEMVCEGCGDCSTQSNCLSVEPLDTEFGRKRQINQNTCNKDFSCVKGFCPSFVTVEGGTLKKKQQHRRSAPDKLPEVPEPMLPSLAEPWRIIVAGVGGTGVITIGQLLGMAAHLEGKGIVTQDAAGLAQKGGATWSHVQIAESSDAIRTTKIDIGQADLVIACDAIVASSHYTMSVVSEGRTFIALNTHNTLTASFVRDPDWQFPESNCKASLERAVGAESVRGFDVERVAAQLLGDSIYTNTMLLGYAWQMGRVPLSHAALMRAFDLNGVQIDNNKAAFEWGRRCAHNLSQVESLLQTGEVIQIIRKPSLNQLVRKRADVLVDYQNTAYASDYQAFVERVRIAESAFSSTKLTEAVARYLFKLMAYKDEYEVARMHSSAEFKSKLDQMFEGDFKVVHHLAPPMFAKTNEKGELVKRAYGPWIRTAFSLLAKLKWIRGTALDPFGRTDERKTERALIFEYRDCIEELLQTLCVDKLSLAVRIASIPEEIRGYGHVKARHLADARKKWASLRDEWRRQGAAQKAS